MPYRETPREARCRYCFAPTARACMRCAHPVCGDCEARHDASFEHRDYTG